MVKEMLVTLGKYNTIPAIKPLSAGGTHRVKYNGAFLPISDLATSLPALGVKVTNDSTQPIYVYFNNDRDKGDSIGAGGRERAFDKFSVYDIYIENDGDEEIAAGEISILLYNDLETLYYYNELKRTYPQQLSTSTVGGAL
jgi:hypothetical protein